MKAHKSKKRKREEIIEKKAILKFEKTEKTKTNQK